MSLIPYTAGGGQASAALLTFASDGNTDYISAGTHTYSSQGIGVASSDRVVLVSIYSLSLHDVQSITCGGVSMTKIRAANYDTYGKSSIWGVAYPTGTTADIVVTYSSSSGVYFNAIGVYALTGTASDFTKFDFGSDTASSTMSTTLDIPANGAVLVTGGADGGSAFSADAGFTEDWEEITTVSPGVAGGGSASHLAAETARTITATTNDTTHQALLAVSFGP